MMLKVILILVFFIHVSYGYLLGNRISSRYISVLKKSSINALLSIKTLSSTSNTIGQLDIDEFITYSNQFITSSSTSILVDIRNELYNRLSNISDINKIGKCLWLLTIVNKQVDRFHDNTNRLDINLSSVYLGLEDDVIVTNLLNSLIDNKIRRWRDLPNNFRESLLTKIVSLSSLKDCLIEILVNLSKLGIDYNRDTNITFKTIIMTTIKENSELYHKDISTLIYAMSRMNLKWNKDIDDNVKDFIVKATTEQIVGMKERDIVNIIYAIGKMDLQWMTLPEKTQIVILKEIERIIILMRSPGLANVFLGLGKCNVKWNTLPFKMRTKLLDQVVKLAPLDTHATISTIKGLGKMSAIWSSLPENVRNVLELGLPSISDNLTELAVSSALWSLGRLQAVDKKLKRDTKLKLFDNVLHVAPTFSDQGISNTFYGFANMKFQYNKIPVKVIKSLESACSNKLNNMDNQAVANIIWSLGQMNATWINTEYNNQMNVISDDFRSHLLKAIDRSVEKMTEQGLSNTLLGLAKMSTQWIHLPDQTRSILFRAIVNLSGKFNQQGVSNVYWALATLGLSWDLLSEQPIVLQALSDAIVRVKNTLQSQSSATCYYSIARMDARYDSIPISSRESLEASFVRCASSMKGIEIANTIYGLGKLGPHFRDLPNDMQHAIMSAVTNSITSMDEQEIGNTLWGLGRLGIGYSMMSKTLQGNIIESIVSNQSRLRKQALIAIIHGLGKNGDIKWQQMPEQLTKTLLLAAVRVCNIHGDENSRDLRLIGNLLQMLGKLQLHWNSDDFFVYTDSSSSSLSSSSIPFNVELLKSFNRTSSNNQELGRAIANSLSGIAMMQADWESLGSDIVSILSAAIQKSINDVSTNEFASILWSLGRMGADLNQMSSSLQSSLLDALTIQLVKMNPYEFAWSAWALGRMKIQYASLPEQCLLTFQTAAGNLIGSMEERELGVTLWALGQMQAPINEFSLETRSVFHQLIINHY